LGSGALLDTTAVGLAAEPRIQDSLLSGVDLLASSADKLLGGPQAGLLLGRSDLVERVMKHPLARAVRVDKLTTAALAATLDLYLTQSLAEVPIWGMLRASTESLRSRAPAWLRRLAAPSWSAPRVISTTASPRWSKRSPRSIPTGSRRRSAVA